MATRIYIGNLSFRSTEKDIRKVFEVHGEVSSVSLAVDRATGRSRGFAFVDMPDDAQAQAAIASMNNKEISGRAVTVKVAVPETDRDSPRPRR